LYILDMNLIRLSIILLFLSLFLPGFGFADTEGSYFRNDMWIDGLHLDTSTTQTIKVQMHNLHDVSSSSYFQLQIYYNNFGSEVCSSVYGPYDYDTNTDTMSIDLDSSQTSLSYVGYSISDSNSVDGNGCLTADSGITSNELLSNDFSGSDILFGLPSGGTTTISSSTVQTVDNPALDFFLGIFLAYLSFWIFVTAWRRRTT